jgi:hypothetical protein
VPAEARDIIHTVRARIGDSFVESSAWGTDPKSIIYSFDGSLEEGTVVELTIRRGFRSMPLRIELKEQPLP